MRGGSIVNITRWIQSSPEETGRREPTCVTPVARRGSCENYHHYLIDIFVHTDY